jgi:DNA polymerase I-like protein with 3'-5' exonuclease and polymerase domains
MPKHRFIAEKVESPTAVYVGIMKYNGFLADADLMRRRSAECEERLAKLREDIAFIIGDVNIGANASTSAFKEYLYKDLGLQVLKSTAKYQEAADDETMILLSEWCAENRPELAELFKLVQEYRKVGKMKSTYIDGYGKHINPATGRIHADLMPLATETGRFAARNPNLQNCFDDQTEILTKRGFILFRDIKPDDEAAQWDNGDIYFVKPEDYIARRYKGRLVSLKNQHIDLVMTPDHRCLLQNRKNRKFFLTSADNYSSDAKQLHSAQYKFGDMSLSQAEITLLVAAQADASYHDGGLEFCFMKARKYIRLVNALRAANSLFTESIKKDGKARVRISAQSSNWIYNLLGERKVWGSWLLKFDRKTVKSIIEELNHWDGCFTRGSMYSSSVKENVEWMQILHALTGRRAHFREYRNGNPNASVNYQLDIVDRDYSLTANIERNDIEYDGMVYCVSVPSGFIMVRRNGQICITGNCPRTGNDDIGVRNFFTAPEGKVLMSLDFSQIELRVGAFYCRDEKMMATYRVGGDIHDQTGTVIYGEGKHDKEQRTIAKNVNFGFFYGLFPKGLQRTLKFKAGVERTAEECQEIIGNLKSGYPKLAEWQEETIDAAKRTRFTETWLGRRRYLPDIASKDWNKRSFSERCALNTPIQGTAADILKLALGRIIEGLPERPWLKPLLQIHDELVFELPEDSVSEALVFIKQCMEEQPFPGFDVPIIAEAAIGRRFGEMAEMGD